MGRAWWVALVFLWTGCVEAPVAPEAPGLSEEGLATEEEEVPETPPADENGSGEEEDENGSGDEEDDKGSGDEELELQPLPGATAVEARAINGLGQVVGSSGGRAVIWEAGVPTALPRLPGSFEDVATSINDAGQIVGVAQMGEEAHLAPYRAVLWEDGEVTDLGTLPGDNGARANHIDNAGRIVGHSTPAIAFYGAWTPRVTTAVVWIDGEIRPLPTPEEFPARPNADFSNTSGLILGTSFEPEGDTYGRFVIWNPDGEIVWAGGTPGDGAGVLEHWVGITEAGDAFVTDTEHWELELHWRDGGPTGVEE